VSICRTKPDDFEFLKVIGKGSFGKVCIALLCYTDNVPFGCQSEIKITGAGCICKVGGPDRNQQWDSIRTLLGCAI